MEIQDSFSLISVGQVMPGFSGMPEGTRFSVVPGGYCLIYNFNSPTQKELQAVQPSQSFEIRYLLLDGVIWILTKFGNLPWCDAPFCAQLMPSDVSLEDVADGEGTALTFFLLDAPRGIVRFIRLIGLGTDFSRSLASCINAEREKPFVQEEFDRKLANQMRKYTTLDFVRMASVRWKLSL